ncbi:MAG: hypothetical protein QOE51_718 [Actinoplanes sp.]|jgi:hypothetical protein|nr:hypothetical protein [Actinoplanes sp.]
MADLVDPTMTGIRGGLSFAVAGTWPIGSGGVATPPDPAGPVVDDADSGPVKAIACRMSLDPAAQPPTVEGGVSVPGRVGMCRRVRQGHEGGQVEVPA